MYANVWPKGFLAYTFPRFPDLQIDCFQVTSKCVCTNHSLSSFSTAFFSMMNSFLFCNSHNKIEKTIFQKVIKENLKISSSSFLLEKLPKEMKKPFFWPIFSLVAERAAVWVSLGMENEIVALLVWMVSAFWQNLVGFLNKYALLAGLSIFSICGWKEKWKSRAERSWTPLNTLLTYHQYQNDFH